MPFEHGSLTVTIFSLPGQLPENLLELFEAKKAGLLDHVQEEPQIGWVSGRHLLETTIDESTGIRGGHIYLNLRKAERKMPGTLLNAICKREELVYMQANQSAMVPTRVKREIKKETLEKHLMKMPPGIAGVSMVIDRTANLLYVGTASTAQLDNFIALFFKTTNIEPLQLNPGLILADMYEITESSLPGVMFSKHADGEMTTGRDFLTWLWYYSENEGGKVTHEQFGEFDVMVEAPLSFAFAAEARGAAETTLKKGGSPLRSAEAKAALIVGKKLKKAKLLITGREVWSGTFDADRFAFCSLNLPEGEEMDAESRFAERIQNLYIFQEIIKLYFKKFTDTVRDIRWAEEEKKIQQWAQERDSY